MAKTPKKIIKLLVKICLTVVLLYVVLRQIDLDALKALLLQGNLWMLFLAFAAFNLSKILSSVRLNFYFNALQINMTEWKNLILYYIGMFYNLFLPGGIGGDGYKIYLLQKHFSAGYKNLIAATLLDRVSGAVGLLFFGGIFFLISSFTLIHDALNWLVVFGTLLLIPVFYYLSKRYFTTFMPVFRSTLMLGFAVQLAQILAAYFIFKALFLDHLMIEGIVLFLISSLVAILPITIGGVGVRELVFLYGFDFLQSDATVGVAFALLFFTITALSSLIGAFLPNPFGQK